MSDLEGGTPQAPAALPASAMLAGKFAGIPALEQGIREIHKHPGLGLPPPAEGVPLIGDGRMFKTEKDAEGWYLGMEKLASRGAAPKAEPPAPAPSPKADTPTPPSLEIPGLNPEPVDDNIGMLARAEKAGIDLDAAGRHLRENKALRPEDDAAIAKAHPTMTKTERLEYGMSLIRSVDDVFTDIVQSGQTMAGGEQQLKTILQYAGTLPNREQIQKDIKNFRNPGAAKQAIFELVRSYEAKHGRPATSAPAGQTPAAARTGETFKSHNELSDLMRRVNAGDKAAIDELNRRGPDAVTAALKGRI